MLFNEPSPLETKVLTRRFGLPNSASIDTYLATEGYQAFLKAARMKPEEIIDQVKISNLRGRGGAGFPTGQKWRMVRQQPGDTKYVICNGDEGDPGAFMDRMILESFPYRVIEGLAIAAVAVGAHEAVFYVRHEYPQALRRIKAALAKCEQRGWLGDRLGRRPNAFWRPLHVFWHRSVTDT